jgi:hypothetical protein
MALIRGYCGTDPPGTWYFVILVENPPSAFPLVLGVGYPPRAHTRTPIAVTIGSKTASKEIISSDATRSRSRSLKQRWPFVRARRDSSRCGMMLGGKAFGVECLNLSLKRQVRSDDKGASSAVDKGSNGRRLARLCALWMSLVVSRRWMTLVDHGFVPIWRGCR